MIRKNTLLLFVISAMLMFLAMVFAIAGDIFTAILFLIPCIFLLFHTNVIIFYHSLKSHLTGSASIESQRQSMSGWIYRYVLRFGFFTKMDKSIRKALLSGTIPSGTLSDPVSTSKNIIVFFVISIIIATSLSVIGLIILSEVLFLASWVLPGLVRVSPYILNTMKSSEMTSYYDEELAYFLAYLQISITCGIRIYDAMSRLIGKDILTSVEHDGIILQKWMEKDGYAESVAINHLANEHSHKDFQSFLFSYYEISQSNPHGLENLVSQAADLEFEKISTRELKTIGKLSSVFIYGAMAMIMIPVMMLTMLFMNSDDSTIQMITYAVFGIPLGFTMYVFFSNNRHSDVTLHSIRISLIGLCVGPVWYIITSDVLTSAALSVSVTALYNGFFVNRQISSWRSKTDGFPVFVRDLIERCKVDSNFVVSVVKLIESKNIAKKYGLFSEVIDDVGSRMYEVTDKTKKLFYDGTLESRRLKLMMFVLQTVFDGGRESSISGLERIHGFASKLNHLKNTADDSLKMSSLLLYAATPVFFIAMVGLSTVLMSFTSNMPDVSDLPAGAQGLEIFVRPDYAELLDAMQPAVLIMSLCSGLVISRVAYSSLVASMPVGVCGIMAFVILTGWDFFFEVIASIL